MGSHWYNCKVIGIIFDEKLNFIPHIEFVTSKALKLASLYRFTDIKDFRALRSNVLTCVLHTIEYCSSIWSMACETNLSKLHKVQNFFILIVQHRVPNLQHKSNVDILNSFDLKNVDTRKKTKLLKISL